MSVSGGGGSGEGGGGSVEGSGDKAESAEAESSTHFGFKTVAVEDKAALVGEVFHSVADR